MGLFSKIFTGFAKSKIGNTSFLGAYRESQGKSANWGGWALDRFNSIVDAHSSVEELVEQFNIAGEDGDYMSLDGYDNPYDQAYEEEYEKAQAMADVLSEFGIDIDPEELIDYEVVEEKAWNYACELVQAWLDGEEWTPQEIMDYAWYDLSDHNA